MAKFSFGSIAFIMICLFIGGFVSTAFILPMIPQAQGIFAGIITGMIQMLILLVFGLASKTGFWGILWGSIMLLIGGILGGFITNYLALTGWFATITVLLVQAIILLFTGIAKGKGLKL